MPPLIISKPPPGRIRYAVEKMIDGKRMLQIRREHDDTQTVTDEWVEMPASDRPMLLTMNIVDDLDEIALRDIIQSVCGRKASRRLTRPNITLLYHEFNEMRAAELKGKRQFRAGST